jgi:hypothetical protein
VLNRNLRTGYNFCPGRVHTVLLFFLALVPKIMPA